MKKLTLFLLAAVSLSAQAFGQAAYSGILTAQTTESITGRTVVVPAPLATITVYGYGTTVKSTVCPTVTIDGTCTSSAPNNPITADSQGNFGFFIAAGAYDYTVTPVSGTVQGPYHIFLPLGITPPSTISLSGTIIPASSGGTGANNTPTSGRGLKGNGSTFVTTSVAPGGSGTVTCTNQFLRVHNVNADAVPTGTCATVTTTDTDTTIAKTGVDVNTSNQVTATHLAAALPVLQGGTGVTSSTGSGAVVLGTSPSLTTPTMSAPTMTGNTSMATGTMSGLMTNYNGIACVSNCFPQEVATVDLTAQTAAVATATLYAVPSTGQGQYLLQWNAKVTTAAGTSSTLGALTVVYTDPDGVVQTLTAGAFVTGGSVSTTSTANTTNAVLLGVPMLLNCKASTNITYAMAYASNAANAMNYNLHLKLAAE